MELEGHRRRPGLLRERRPIMASISTDAAGRRRILFIDKNRTRKAVRLGKVSKRYAEEVRLRVESLNSALVHGCSVERDTAEWLRKIGDDLHAKIVQAGLAEPREEEQDANKPRLADFLDRYIVGRTDIKPRTRINLDAARRRLVEFFGKDKRLDAIHAGDVDAWIVSLKGRYADATAGRTIKRARQFFRSAVRRKLLTENPFSDAKAPSQVNEAREVFVSRAVSEKVLAACPDTEWELIFALARYGGLRCPSEHLALKWTDIDWERERFRVDSPKTKHNKGGVRWVPIFPELAKLLDEAYTLAAEGAVHVITRYRDSGTNLRTQLMRIIRKAGLEPWEKLFQNLRSTRETELAETYPIHVVCKWLGNTPKVARDHYLQVTEDHFAAAAGRDAQNDARNPGGTHNPAQSRAARHGPRKTETPANTGFSEYSPGNEVEADYPQGDSNPCLSLERAMS
jgi:integrase